MEQDKKKWGNIRNLQKDIDSWIAFLDKHNLGSLPTFAKNWITKGIEHEKKRLK